MNNNRIVVHCLVKNEENFIWYAVNSVLPFVDKIMIWDNGSTDKTVEIIKTINSPKIDFEEHPVNSREEVASLRQEMLNQTPSKFDWLLILDGDEIWAESSIKKVISYISKNPLVDTVVTNTYNLVGDIYHRLPEKFGNYIFNNKKGNLSLRFVNLKNISGLHLANSYGNEGYFDAENKPIQNRSNSVFLDVAYYHATHLLRSTKNHKVFDRPRKLKFYLGIKNNNDSIPKIFFSDRPSIVPDMTRSMSIAVKIFSLPFTIIRNIKFFLTQK